MQPNTQPNPLQVIRECERIADKSEEGKAFQKASLILMGAMVAASVGGVMLQLWRELNRKDRDHDRGR